MFVGLSLTLFVVLLVWAIRTPSRWETLVKNASQDGLIEPLIEELDRRPDIFRPKFYDQAMQLLFRTNIDAAIRLTLVVVPKNHESKQIQYWLRNLRTIEPQNPLLTTEFLERYTTSCCSAGVG